MDWETAKTNLNIENFELACPLIVLYNISLEREIMTEKTVNYTEAQEARLREAYVGNESKETVEALATELGKTARSIVAKLVRMELYKSESKAEAGKRGALKSEMVTEIAELVGASEEAVESLEKATAGALKLVLKALKAE